MTIAGCEVRAATAADVDALVELCAAHAAFEQASYDRTSKGARLREALFGATPALWAWVAGSPEHLAGYATATVDYATWDAEHFLHMDCLYVRAESRNRNIGAALLGRVVAYAAARGCRRVEFQTPAWNVDAGRFYLRHGAKPMAKTRFRLAVG